MKLTLPKRIILSFFGVFIISIAVALFRFVDLGTDPCSCLNLGIAKITGLSFGTTQVIVNAVTFAALAGFGIKYFGIGTLFSMFMVGYLSDFVLEHILLTNGAAYPLVLRLAILFVGVLIIGFGVAIYSIANLGISPYDAFSFIVDERTRGRLKFKYVRIVLDVTSVILGFLLGSVVGIGTLIIAFGTGPCVAFMREKVVGPCLKVQKE